LTIGIPIGSHKIYLGKRDKELEKWVEKKIKERKYSSWSHSYVIAMTYLRRVEEPEGF